MSLFYPLVRKAKFIPRFNENQLEVQLSQAPIFRVQKNTHYGQMTISDGRWVLSLPDLVHHPVPRLEVHYLVQLFLLVEAQLKIPEPTAQRGSVQTFRHIFRRCKEQASGLCWTHTNQ
jgi:hypothetical protein